MFTSGKTRNKVSFPTLELKMGNTTLERVKSIKYLGVIIDENFNWSQHITNLKSKLASSVGIISKLRYYVDTKILIQVYHALVASRIHYAITCWGATTKTALNPIRLLQNRAIGFISRASRYTRLDVAYLNLRILRFDDVYKLKLIQFLRDYQQNCLPPFFSNYFQNTSSVHNYPTHHSETNTFRPIRCNKITAQRSIRFRAPTHWNQLPPVVKTASKKKFKKEFKKHIFPFIS